MIRLLDPVNAMLIGTGIGANAGNWLLLAPISATARATAR